MAHATGGGTTLAFGAGITATADVRSFTGPGFEAPAVNDSHLGSTKYEEYLPGDLVDIGEIEMTIAVHPNQIINWVGATAIDATGLLKVGDLDITWTDSAGLATTITLTGFVRAFNLGNTANNEEIEATMIFRPDGKSDPVFV